MFNKKLKQELQKYKEAYFIEKNKVNELSLSYDNQSREMSRLMNFEKIMLDKIEEICKPKIDKFCLSLTTSGLFASSAVFDSSINILSKNYKSLEDLLTEQAKDIKHLKEREEDTKKILFLSGRVEELLRELSKMKISEVKSLKNKK